MCKRAQEVLAGAQTTDGCEEIALAKILNSAYQLTLQYGLADFEMYDLLLGFVQSNVHYETDDKSESIGKVLEYFRYASETLYEKKVTVTVNLCLLINSLRDWALMLS